MENRSDTAIQIILAAALFEWRSKYSKALPSVTLSAFGLCGICLARWMEWLVSVLLCEVFLCIVGMSLGAAALLPSWLAVVSWYSSSMMSSLSRVPELRMRSPVLHNWRMPLRNVCTLTPGCQKIFGEASSPLELWEMCLCSTSSSCLAFVNRYQDIKSFDHKCIMELPEDHDCQGLLN